MATSLLNPLIKSQNGKNLITFIVSGTTNRDGFIPLQSTRLFLGNSLNKPCSDLQQVAYYGEDADQAMEPGTHSIASDVLKKVAEMYHLSHISCMREDIVKDDKTYSTNNISF